MTLQLLGAAAVVGSGLVAGVLFAVALSTLPALFALPPARYVEVHRLLGAHWDPTMPILVLSSMAADAVLASRWPAAAARPLFLAAAVLLLGVSGVSHLGNVPLNREVKTVDAAALPPTWRDPRPRWRRWHLLRTGLALLALMLNAGAVTAG